MENSSFQMIDGKVIIRIKDRICDNADELLSSELFLRVFNAVFPTWSGEIPGSGDFRK